MKAAAMKAHILNEQTMVATCHDDDAPIARVTSDESIVITTRGARSAEDEFHIAPGVASRQARQLAYLLCEAADAIDRGDVSR